MRSLSSRVTLGVAYAWALFAVAAVVIGVVGIVGVRSAISAGNQISSDELATSSATAAALHDIDSAYATGQAMMLSTSPSGRAQLATQLDNQQIPDVEARLATLRQLHAGDEPEELADITQLGDQWTALRAVLTQGAVGSAVGTDEALASQLSTAFAPLSSHLTELVEREDHRRDDRPASGRQ